MVVVTIYGQINDYLFIDTYNSNKKSGPYTL